MKNALIDPVTLTFLPFNPKPYHFLDIPRSFHVPSFNTLGSFDFSYAADKQTNVLKRPTYAEETCPYRKYLVLRCPRYICPCMLIWGLEMSPLYMPLYVNIVLVKYCDCDKKVDVTTRKCRPS